MKRYFIIALSLFIAVGATDVSAQSFFKKLEKEVKTQVKKGIKKGSKSSADKSAQQSSQNQQQSTKQQSSKSSIPPGAIAPTIVDVAPNYTASGSTATHQWVDLGLPSGTRWAVCNVGASKAEQPGSHYAWGETATKSSYTQATSKNNAKEMTDISGNKTYDAATAKWGKGWRTPTKAEFDELLHYCGWGYEQKGGRWGALLGSSINDKSIFLPVTGYKEGTKLLDSSGNGMYWTSTPYTDNYNNGAHQYHFGGALGEMGVGERAEGYAIRAVIDNTDMVTTPSQGQINGHGYVDLGLPSGTKWATCNLGSDNSEYHGDFYAWGEITDILDKKSPKNKTRDKQMSGIGGSSKYDAATANWGEGWRMPTKKDFEELMENCTWEWTTMGRAKGCKITSKINGNYIFLPAGGSIPKNYSYSFPNNLGNFAVYWASTPSKDQYNINADAIRISQKWVGTTTTDRKDGYSIRPVSK